MGDGAHASTPHQGQGAGMAFEDSLILNNILGQVLNDPQTTSSSINIKLKACLYAYEHVRRPRTQKVTGTSRGMGEKMEFATASMGSDLAKLKPILILE
jgi:salicylate hydroxylase